MGNLSMIRAKLADLEKRLKYGNGNIEELRTGIKGLTEHLAEAEKAEFDRWQRDAAAAKPKKKAAK